MLEVRPCHSVLPSRKANESVKMLARAACLAVMLWGHVPPAFALAVVRGPYLQQQSPQGVTIRWRTDTVTDSVVRYGPSPGNLASSVTLAGSRTEHIVNITGLDPGLRYFYSIGDSNAALAGDASFYFHTAPGSGEAAYTRIWVIGDSGTKDANAARVYSAFKAWSAGDPADLWLMLGDNAYETGTDAEYQAAIFSMYPEILRQRPLWATLGNHDGGSSSSATQTGPYYDQFSFPKNAEAGGYPSGTESYYSFDYANIHFINLNSHDESRAVNSNMLQWLQADLAANQRPWIIAFWHHPPYTKGGHNSDTSTESIEMRQNALPILEAGGVDLVLTGHSHSYERSYLLDGHYGISTSLDPATQVLDFGDGRDSGTGPYQKPNVAAAPHEGTVYAVAGSSGKIAGGALNHPAMFYSLNSLGSMVLDVAGNRMDVSFIDQNGLERDRFTLVKTPDSDPPLIRGAIATNASHVTVDFTEALSPAEAADADNYLVDGLVISQAELLSDGHSVRLTTSVMSEGATYTLLVNELSDLGGHVILPDSSTFFDFTEHMTLAFQDALSPDATYAGTRDSTLRQASATTVHGLETTVRVDGDEPGGTGNDMNMLLSWDISAMPEDAIVESAHLELTATNTSSGSYDCYSLLRTWTETQATWNLAATATAWQSPGAAGSADRGTQKLCTVSPASLGVQTITLAQAGIDLVQSWVNDPADNHGMVISNTSTTDGADFHSRESANAMARPKLVVNYRVPLELGNEDPPELILSDSFEDAP